MGVAFRNGRRYVAEIGYNGKSIYIGSYDTAIEAAQARDAKAIELFGEFASLNFPPKTQETASSASTTMVKCLARPTALVLPRRVTLAL